MEASVSTSKNNLMESSPGAQKNDPSLFLPYTANKCLSVERRITLSMDVDKIEAAEKALDEFINARSRQKKEAIAEEEMWRAGARRHRHKIRLANGRAWVEYFDHLAFCHERRADEYRDRSREVSAMVDTLADEGEGVAASETMSGN